MPGRCRGPDSERHVRQSAAAGAHANAREDANYPAGSRFQMSQAIFHLESD